MKTLCIPSRVWNSLREFVNEFPEAKLAFILAYMTPKIPTTGRDPWSPQILVPKFSTGLSSWDISRKVEFYKDVIRYSISPATPIELDFSIDRAALYSTVEALTGQALFLSHLKTAAVVNVEELLQLRGDNLVNFVLNWLDMDYLTPQSIIDANKTYSVGLAIYKSVLKAQIIEAIINTVSFRAWTPSETRNFRETYGVKDANLLAAYTINYDVIGQPPPVDVPYDNMDFWSAVFSSQTGMAILNAAADNMPVKVKTQVTAWQNPDSAYYSFTESKDALRWSFTYIWQDFIIEVTPNYQIFISYNRGADTLVIERTKKEAWKNILMGVGLVAAFVGAAVLATGGLAGGGAAATGAATSEAGTLTAAETTALLGGGAAPSVGLTASETTALLSGGAGSALAATSPGLLDSLGGIVSKIGGAITTGLGILTGVEQFKQLKESGELRTVDASTTTPLRDNNNWLWVFIAAGLVTFVAIKLIKKGKGKR